MESLNNILKKSLNKEFLSAIISNPREKGGIVKIKIRPVEHKDNILYQCEEHRNNQVFHHNLNEEEALYPGGRKSSSIFTGSGSYDKRRGNRADKV